MKKIILLSPVCLLLSITLFSQKKTQDFELSTPEQKIGNSLYQQIECLDSRPDTTNLGIVQLGLMNTKARVVPKTPFPVQLTRLMNSLTDSTAKNGRLLLQLKHFSFAEVTGAVSEKGYFYFRAILYADSNGGYRTIASIDTLIVVKAMDVTKPMLRRGNELITGFIAGNLLNRPADTAAYYTMNDVINVDSIEKLKLKLYTSTTYQEGLYLNYASFRDQVPDKQIISETKKDVVSVRTGDASGKLIKVKPKDVFAIVVKGQPLIATEFGFYPLEKRNNDFFFTGKAKVTANAADVAAASMFFGIIGGLLASSSDVAIFEMQIDHVSGGFIRLREIPMAATGQN
jgi:hypothetical protein